jgi:hypothetical protein
MTPTQKYLESIDACSEAREWVGDRDLKTCWDECTRLDWLRFVVKAPALAAYNEAMAPARAAHNKAMASAWAAYDGATYNEATASALACATCDELRAKFSCPEVV